MHYKQDYQIDQDVHLLFKTFLSWKKKIIQIQHNFWQSIFYFPLSFLWLSAWKIKEDPA